LGKTVAVNCVVGELVELVIRPLPPHNTVAPLSKPDPLTVRVIGLLPPGATEEGLRDVSVGPLLVPIVNGKGPVVAEPVVTTTFAVPAVVIKLADTVAVSWMGVNELIVSGVPAKETVEVLWNPDPFTVSVKAGPPGAAKLGLRLLMDWAGRTQLKMTCRAAAR
jgi:hypothetical protein